MVREMLTRAFGSHGRSAERQDDKPQILVLQPNAHGSRLLCQKLQHGGYCPIWHQDGRCGLNRLKRGDIDLVLLEVTLPYLDGISLVESVRASGSLLPMIFFTTRCSLKDRLLGLEAGADDYLSREIHHDELMLRIRSQLKRKNKRVEGNHAP